MIDDPRRWGAFLLTPDRNEIQEISFKNATFSIKHLGVGGWSLTTTREWIPYDVIEWGMGLLIEYDNESVFSGYLTGRKRERGRSDIVTLTGKSDLGLVERRLASPDPSEPLDAPASSRDIRTGPAGNIIAEYVHYNAGQGAISERQTDILYCPIPSGDVGSEITGRARYNNLVEFCKVLAERAGDVGFNALQPSDGDQIVFEVWEAQDLREEIIFSEGLGNLHSFRYEINEPETTYVVAGGRGEGQDRLIISGEDDDASDEFGRIETFLDRRNAGDEDDEQSQVDEIEDSIEDEFKGALGRGTKESLEAKVINTKAARFIDDYRVGDIVSVEIDAHELIRVPQVVREAEISLAPGGVKVDLLIGSISERKTLKAFQDLRLLSRDVSETGRH